MSCSAVKDSGPRAGDATCESPCSAERDRSTARVRSPTPPGSHRTRAGHAAAVSRPAPRNDERVRRRNDDGGHRVTGLESPQCRNGIGVRNGVRLSTSQSGVEATVLSQCPQSKADHPTVSDRNGL